MAQDLHREKLQQVFEDILGSRNVYFQPPATVKLQYPCIIYHRSKIDAIFADNIKYTILKRWDVTVIDADPDSHITVSVGSLKHCKHDRFYTANNLNHDTFTLYF